MKNWKCRFGWHNWTNWSEPESETWIWHTIGEEGKEYSRTVQKRKCYDCEIVDLNYLEDQEYVN